MSEVKVNKISPRTNCGTVQLGDSGDTITIPAGATITNNGTQTGFGRTGTVNWQTTIKTGDFTAANGEGYFVDTSSGTVEVTLPSSPSAGNIVAVSDYAENSATNNITIARNGSNIEGSASNFTINTNGSTATLVYADSTKGWIVVNAGNSDQAFTNPFICASGGTITTCGNDKIHTFTGPGTFTVNAIGATAANNCLSYMVVAGGGSAGNPGTFGAGGAGGFRESKSPTTTYTASPLNGYPTPGNRMPITCAGAYPVTVGSGGAGGTSSQNNGSNSVFNGITSAGGGSGGNSGSGGSGGGGRAEGSGFEGGSGNTPPTTPSQGNDGGDGVSNGSGNRSGGGGGGAGAAGGDANPSSSPTPSSTAGAGGIGVPTGIAPASGTTGPAPGKYFSGGGGGGAGDASSTNGSAGGAGGGGTGFDPGDSVPTIQAGIDATANTGGGGGNTGRSNPGFCNQRGGNGGSGIVVIRYKYQ